MNIGKLITVIFLILSFTSWAQDEYVVAYGKLKIEWGNTEKSKITLFEDGKEIDTYRPEKNGKFQFTLELNHTYIFWFEKRGYVTKKVQFNTAVPESVTSDPEFIPFADFDFYVTLFETYPEVDTMFFKKPVGKIQYSAQRNDFDWDKEYTLEIQRSMEEIEKEIKEKHEQKIKEEEEKKANEQRLRETKLAREDAEKKRLKKEEKARNEAEKQVQKEQDKLAKEQEAKNKALEKLERQEKLTQEDEKKQEFVETDESHTAQLSNQKNTQNKDTVEKSPPPVGKEKPPGVSIDKVIENKQNISKKTVNISSVQKTSYDQPVTKNEVKKVDIAGKTTSRTEITENGITLTYIKVEYTWGGRFFFIEDEPGVYRNISEIYYNRKIINK